MQNQLFGSIIYLNLISKGEYVEELNLYCDESCHLLNEPEKVMLVSCTYCPKESTYRISQDLKNLRKKHKIYYFSELKWGKVSKSKINYYLDVLDYFFNCKDIYFRTIVIPDKFKLDHKKYNQNHNQWYYKMIYELVKYIAKNNKDGYYNIYVDKKENSCEAKCQLNKSKECLQYKYKNIKMQNIRSHESEIMQLNDFLQGAVGYYNRKLYNALNCKNNKSEIVHRLLNKYHINLSITNYDEKFNILRWEANHE